MRILRRLWPVAAVAALGAVLIATMWNQDPNSVTEESFGSLMYERSARSSMSRAEFVARFRSAEANVAAYLGPLSGKVQVIVVDKLVEPVVSPKPGEPTEKLVRARIEYSGKAGHLSQLTMSASELGDDTLLTVTVTRLRLLELAGGTDHKTVTIGDKTEWLADAVGYFVADPGATAYSKAFDVWTHRTGVTGSAARDLSEQMYKLGVSRVRGFLVVAYLNKVKGWELPAIAKASEDDVVKLLLEDKMLRERYDWNERDMSTVAYYIWPKVRPKLIPE